MSFFSLSHCKLTAPSSLTEDHDKIRATPPLPPNVKSQRKYIVSEFVYSLPSPLPQLLIITAIDQVSYGSNVGEISNTDFSYMSSMHLWTSVKNYTDYWTFGSLWECIAISVPVELFMSNFHPLLPVTELHIIFTYSRTLSNSRFRLLTYLWLFKDTFNA